MMNLTTAKQKARELIELGEKISKRPWIVREADEAVEGVPCIPIEAPYGTGWRSICDVSCSLSDEGPTDELGNFFLSDEDKANSTFIAAGGSAPEILQALLDELKEPYERAIRCLENDVKIRQKERLAENGGVMRQSMLRHINTVKECISKIRDLENES